MSEHAAEQPVPAPPSTGIESVDEALSRVASLDEQPIAEHASVFEAAQVALQRPLDHPPVEPSAATESA